MNTRKLMLLLAITFVGACESPTGLEFNRTTVRTDTNPAPTLTNTTTRSTRVPIKTDTVPTAKVPDSVRR